jgi:hypothetical protein
MYVNSEIWDPVGHEHCNFSNAIRILKVYSLFSHSTSFALDKPFALTQWTSEYKFICNYRHVSHYHLVDRDFCVSTMLHALS